MRIVIMNYMTATMTATMTAGATEVINVINCLTAEDILESISDEMNSRNDPHSSLREWEVKVHLGNSYPQEVVAEVIHTLGQGVVIPTLKPAIKPTPMGVNLVARWRAAEEAARLAYSAAHDEFVRVLRAGKGEEYDELLFATREERRVGTGHALDGMWESAHNHIRGI